MYADVNDCQNALLNATEACIMDLETQNETTCAAFEGVSAELAKCINDKVKTSDKASTLEKLKIIRDQLATAGGRYPQPKLVDQINYLSRMLDRADQRPGRDAYDRYKELSQSLAKCIADLKTLINEGRFK